MGRECIQTYPLVFSWYPVGIQFSELVKTNDNNCRSNPRKRKVVGGSGSHWEEFADRSI